MIGRHISPPPVMSVPKLLVGTQFAPVWHAVLNPYPDASESGAPLWIRVMPEICPSQLPGGYASLGVIQEPGMPTPIGFSRRQIGPVDIVGPNCGLCHTASVRATPSSPRAEGVA